MNFIEIDFLLNIVTETMININKCYINCVFWVKNLNYSLNRVILKMKTKNKKYMSKELTKIFKKLCNY